MLFLSPKCRPVHDLAAEAISGNGLDVVKGCVQITIEVSWPIEFGDRKYRTARVEDIEGAKCAISNPALELLLGKFNRRSPRSTARYSASPPGPSVIW